MVIWLMGLSGAGKTTLGNKLKEHLDKLGKKSFVVDGNPVRSFFDNTLGYSREERVIGIKRIMLAAHILGESGTIAIVCSIHPFEKLRQFARKKIRDYHEIYLTGQREKHLKGEIVGVDIRFDKPKHSDLIVNTGCENVNESLNKIICYCGGII